MRHKLTLEQSAPGPGVRPVCACGWSGLPRAKRTAEGEYRSHRRQQDAPRDIDVVSRRPLTPLNELPEALRGAHPQARFEAAVDAAVERIVTRGA